MKKADLHIHTNYSDGINTPQEVIEFVKSKTDLSIIGICDHNTIDGALWAQDYVRRQGISLEVVVGEEILTQEGEILGLFLYEQIPPRLSAVETINRIHEQEGLAIIPHPGLWPFGLLLPDFLGLLGGGVLPDGLEVINASSFRGIDPWWSVLARDLGLAQIASSDSHVVRYSGRAWVEFMGKTARDLKNMITQARVIPRYLQTSGKGRARVRIASIGSCVFSNVYYHKGRVVQHTPWLLDRVRKKYVKRFVELRSQVGHGSRRKNLVL